MPRYQIVVHLRDNPWFSFDDLIELENFLGDQGGLGGAEIDGHDYGYYDSNIFLFSEELENTVCLIVKCIDSRSLDLNFAIGARSEIGEAEYDIIACRGICEIIMQ